MCTKYRPIFDALAAQFEPGQVKTRSQGGRQFSYVTARTVMNRLDEVLGVANWWDDYTPLEHSVICRLSIRLPDGTVVTKSDAGGEAGMADAGDNDKSGFSDAFKRAAVKFGVSRYLYGDGVARLAGPTPPPAAAIAPAPAPAAPASPAAVAPAKKPVEVKTGRQLYRFAANCRIDRDLLRWMLATFTQFDSKVSNWSQAQVEYALPEIRAHLLEVAKAAREHAA